MIVAIATAAHGKTVYVDTATGSNSSNGLSWAAAKATVANGLTACAYGDDLWVAEGVYNETFSMRSGVAIYGGFEYGDTAFDDRDTAANVTTLSNAARIVSFTLSGISNAVLDGFTLTGVVNDYASPVYAADIGVGNAVQDCIFTSNAPTNSGKGGSVILSQPSGASNEPLILRDCIISNNLSSGIGCGIKIGGRGRVYAYDCVIRDNQALGATTDGAAIGLSYPTEGSEVKLFRCVIADNYAERRGGVVAGNGWTTNEVVELVNCLIDGNTAGASAPGIQLSGELKAVNCTFVNHYSSATWSGVAIHCDHTADWKLTLVNCLFAGNDSDADKGNAIYEADAGVDPAVSNCLFYDNGGGDLAYNDGGGGTYGVGGSQAAIDGVPWTTDCVYGDPQFVNAASDFMIQGGSAALNAGTSTDAPADDIRGVARPQNGAYDIGAYEYQPSGTVIAIR
jgi:hypothetical protein